MKPILLLSALFALILPVAAQQINNLDDIAFRVKTIDSNKAVKLFEKSLQLHDQSGNPKTYSYQYVADSITGNLIKATIKDDRYNVTRTYFFVNERLIKLYEKRIVKNGTANARSFYFRDNAYSIFSTGQSEIFDNVGTLHIDDEEILTKDFANTSFTQAEPKRKSVLEDAYILLMHFKVVRNKN